MYFKIKLSASATCLDVVKEERDSEREAQNVTVKCCETTSRVSPNQQSDDLPGEEVSKGSPV